MQTQQPVEGKIVSKKTIEGRAKALSVLLRNNEHLGHFLESCLVAYLRNGGSRDATLVLTIKDRAARPAKARLAKGYSAEVYVDLNEPEE